MRVAALALLLLSGCVTQPRPDPPATGLEELQAVAGFELGGRIGVTTASDGFNGSLRWRQSGDELALSVHGALGAGRVEIAGDAGGVEIRSSDGTVQSYADPEQALAEAYGWYLPLRALRYWVLGAPSPDSAPLEALETTALGSPRLSRLVQDGWQVDYTEYRAFDGWVLPRKLTLLGADLRVKLVVRDWRLDASPPAAARLD